MKCHAYQNGVPEVSLSVCCMHQHGEGEEISMTLAGIHLGNIEEII
jgi:hypothetical protein